MNKTFIPPKFRPTKETVDYLMNGAIDMHLHAAPDPDVERRDIIEVALEAQKYGMRGVVAKSFFCPTAPMAPLTKHVAPDVEIFGSIVIGYVTTGGLDYAAEIIDLNARIGCKVVWFPAFDARFWRSEMNQEGGIYILDDAGELKPEVLDILRVIKERDLVVASGHMSYAETEKLFAKAKDMGITKMVATHPLINEWTPMTMEQMKTLADMGAYIEHMALQCTPRCGSSHPLRFIEVIKEIGAERCILATDYGWISESSPAEAMRTFIGSMLTFGCTKEEILYMVNINPAKLLGLDEWVRQEYKSDNA